MGNGQHWQVIGLGRPSVDTRSGFGVGQAIGFWWQVCRTRPPLDSGLATCGLTLPLLNFSDRMGRKGSFLGTLLNFASRKC